MRTRYKIYDSTIQYFITSTIVNWIPVFNNKQNLDALIEAIIYSQKNKEFKIINYVIMPEHFHLICMCDKLVTTIQSIKSYTAKRIIETYEKENNVMILEQFIQSKKEHKTESKYQVWQEGFKPKALITESMLVQKSNYIHFNPVKRGLVNEIEDYEYSSARDYYLRKPGRILIDDLDYES
jgi:REP element-mobilizing transposase RayT